jgi:hypothetical protein
MELHDLFDDLENQFGDRQFDWKKQVNCLKLQTTFGEYTYLLAPIVGVNFVAGLDKENADWICFANPIVASINSFHLDDDELPMLREQKIDFVELIKTFTLPVRLAVRYLDKSESAFNLLQIDDQFLISDSQRLIPTASLAQIRVLGTNSWH